MSSSTTSLISRLKSSIVAVANGNYSIGDIFSDRINFLNLKVGLVYSTLPINYTTSGGNDTIVLSSGQVVNTLEKGDVYLGGNTASNVDYSFKLSNLSNNTTYYVRSYIKSGSTGYYKYGNQLSGTTLGAQSGYYISTDTIGFYDPLQIRDTNEGVEKVLTSDSSGLVTWKPVKSLFTFGHYIGELYGGGIVAGVWKEGDDEKVLIAALEDIAPDTFNAKGFNSGVKSTAIQTDGKIIVAGDFSGYLSTTPASGNYITRLNTDGSVDYTFATGTGFNGPTWKVLIQPDGKILVIGGFTSYNGVAAAGIIRLNSDATIDTSFVYGTGFNSTQVRALARRSDGKILVGGNFTTYNGATANRIVRLNSNGTIDSTFVSGTGFDNVPYTIDFQSDGKIIVGGAFTSYNGTVANRIARLNINGAIDVFLSGTGFNTFVYSLVVSPSDDSIVVVGNFNTYNGSATPTNRIVRLNSNGTIDTVGWTTGLGFNTTSLANWTVVLQTDGKILVGGDFTTYNGRVANRIIRLNTDGSIDRTFTYTTGFNNSIWAISNPMGGKILVGGDFTSYLGRVAGRIYYIFENVFGWSSGSGNTTLIGSPAQSKYNGYLNTTAIVAQSNVLGITFSSANYTTSYRGGGYDDWYLPSYYELNQVFNNAAIINKVLNKESLLMLDFDYWTSTEFDSSNAISLSLIDLDGSYVLRSKSRLSKIRAVRKESVYTGDGLILNLDVTNKKSFSDIEYLNNGGTTKWSDLVNGGLTSSYSFDLSTYYSNKPIYFSNQSGFLRFNKENYFDDITNTFIDAGSYVDFKAPVGNTTTVTVETWVRLGSNYSGGMFFGWNTYDVYCTGGGIGYNSSVGDQYGISATQVNNLKLVNNWAHYVFEMKVGSQLGASPSFFSNNKIYINGNEQALSRQQGTASLSNINFNSGLGRIGGWRANDRYFIGMDMSVFRVYNRALTKDEIMKNYSTEKKRYEILPALLTNNLTFNIDFDNPLSYSGDGRTSGVVNDLTGSDRTANLTIFGTTQTPAVQKTSTMYNGKELVFPGTIILNPYLSIPSSTPIQNMTNLSISFWIKFQEHRTAEIIVKWNSTGNTIGPWEVFQRVSGLTSTITFRIRGATSEERVGTKSIVLNKWTHVCATYDNTSKKMKTYIDGVLDVDSFVPNSFSITTALSGDIFIGQYPTTASGERYPLYGSIANVQIYNKALSYGELKNNYDTDKFRFDNFSDANKFFSHEINGNPTFSISQNFSLDFGTASNEKILKMNKYGYGKLVDKTSLFTRPTNYRYIGELYGGGIIVAMWYYPKTIFNYLIMSLEDVSASSTWSNVTSTLAGASSDFKGESNQTSIITQALHTSSAAKLCDNYAGGGFTDWYLPSVFEMNQAFNAGSIIGTVLGSDSLVGEYWTSTEINATTAYVYSFTGNQVIEYIPTIGHQKPNSKVDSNKVRAFRLATNAPIVNPWNPTWDEEYTPWWGRRPYYDWEPVTYDVVTFDYWRRTRVTTGPVTLGSTNTYIVTNSKVTTWETVLEFGICWTAANGGFSTSTPTISDAKVIGSGDYNSYNSTIIYTTPPWYISYTIEVRAYAITGTGTYYGASTFFAHNSLYE